MIQTALANTAICQLLGEAMELILARNESDLAHHPRFIADIIAALEDRMLHPFDAPEDTVTVVARLMTGPLEEIIAEPNVRLYRSRRMVPLHKVREQDTHCVQWLARQPGRSIREKVSAGNRLLAVSRNVGPTKLEHSFALTLCLRLEPSVCQYLESIRSDEVMGDAGQRRVRSAQRLLRAISQYREFAAEHKIVGLHSLPRPSNVLLHERRYRRIWMAARWLAEEHARAQSIEKGAARLWQELVGFTTAAALQRLGFVFVDTGLDVQEPESSLPGNSRLWLGHWFHRTDHCFRKLRIELTPEGDAVVWQLQVGTGDNQSKRFLIATNNRAGADWSMLPGSVQRDGWVGLRNEWELLIQALSEWCELSVSSQTAPSTAEIAPDTGFLRITSTELRFQRNGTLTQTSACAVALRVDGHPKNGNSPLFLTGDPANYFKMLRTCKHADFPGENRLSGAAAGSWIVPGWFFRSCLNGRPLMVETRRSLLHSFVGAASLRRLMVAGPHRLSYAAQSRFYDALPSPIDRKRIIPQPVAIALAWREDNPQGVAEQEWLGVLDLEAEVPDFALLQCKRLQTGDADLGWLRYPAFARNQPPAARWPNQVAAHVLTANGIKITGGSIGSILAQFSEADLIQIADGKHDLAYAWLPSGGRWLRVRVKSEDVRLALKKWAHNVRAHVEKEIDARKTFALAKIIISGSLSAVAGVQEAFGNSQVPVEFMGQDVVLSGMKVFERRLLKGLPTYRDFIPDLKISVRDETGNPYWHSLFAGSASGREASVDQLLVGEEFTFALPAHKETIRLPMMSGNDRTEDDPVVRLESPPEMECIVLVHAQYEAAGRGLVLSLRSQKPGLLPVTELEWDNMEADAVSEELPDLPTMPSLSLKQSELCLFLEELKVAFAHLAMARDQRAPAELKKVLKGLSRLLQKNVSSSATEEWSNAVNSSSSPAIAELLARLGCLLNLRERDLVSPVFPEGYGTFKRPQGKLDLSAIQKDGDLEHHLEVCLSRFAVAAPDGFLKHCLNVIDSPKSRKQVRQACIYSLGRCAGALEERGPRRDATEKLFTTISELAEDTALNSPAEWEEFGYWIRALVIYLAGNPWQISKIPVGYLQDLIHAIAEAIDKLSASGCENENVWGSILGSLLYLRYTMHVADIGVAQFGPRSELARKIVHGLQNAARSPAVRDVARVNLRRFVQNPEILRGETDFEKVAGIWEGKAAGVLLRASVEDE